MSACPAGMRAGVLREGDSISLRSSEETCGRTNEAKEGLRDKDDLSVFLAEDDDLRDAVSSWRRANVKERAPSGRYRRTSSFVAVQNSISVG